MKYNQINDSLIEQNYDFFKKSFQEFLSEHIDDEIISKTRIFHFEKSIYEFNRKSFKSREYEYFSNKISRIISVFFGYYEDLMINIFSNDHMENLDDDIPSQTRIFNSRIMPMVLSKIITNKDFREIFIQKNDENPEFLYSKLGRIYGMIFIKKLKSLGFKNPLILEDNFEKIFSNAVDNLCECLAPGDSSRLDKANLIQLSLCYS